MPVTLAAATAFDDDLWSAIGDPIRRRVIDLLLDEESATATTLGQRLPVTRQAVSKHLGVLCRVGLVRTTSVGRERRYHVNAPQLTLVIDQLTSVGSAWDARLGRIKRVAETIQRAHPD